MSGIYTLDRILREAYTATRRPVYRPGELEELTHRVDDENHEILGEIPIPLQYLLRSYLYVCLEHDQALAMAKNAEISGLCRNAMEKHDALCPVKHVLGKTIRQLTVETAGEKGRPYHRIVPTRSLQFAGIKAPAAAYDVGTGGSALETFLDMMHDRGGAVVIDLTEMQK